LEISVPRDSNLGVYALRRKGGSEQNRPRGRGCGQSALSSMDWEAFTPCLFMLFFFCELANFGLAKRFNCFQVYIFYYPCDAIK
jgi:hypothetical protein